MSSSLSRCVFVPFSARAVRFDPLVRRLGLSDSCVTFLDVSSYHFPSFSSFPRSALLRFQMFPRSFFDILDPRGNPKIGQKRVVFDPKSTPQTVPNGLHMASWAPEASKSDFDRLRTLPRTPLGAPSWPQVGPKSAPSRPEDASRGVKTASK